MSGENIRLLLVEDNSGDARLLQEMMCESFGPAIQVTHAEQLSACLRQLRKGATDLALLDLGLPDAEGLDVVRAVHEAASGVPIVVLTGLDDKSLALEALQEGAQDYLIKGQIDTQSLSRALRYAIERQRTQAELRTLSLTDELTGLHNRRGFLTLAEQHFKIAQRTGASSLLIYFDLDDLKQINDTLGHAEGDRALIQVASAMRDAFRGSDILARLGGDEFVALMAEAPESSAEILRERLRKRLESCNVVRGCRLPLSISVGVVAVGVAESRSLEELLAQADARMYEMKRNKRSAAASIASAAQKRPA